LNCAWTLRNICVISSGRDTSADLDAMFRQLQRDSSTNATGASGDQGVFAIKRHINLLALVESAPWDPSLRFHDPESG